MKFDRGFAHFSVSILYLNKNLTPLHIYYNASERKKKKGERKKEGGKRERRRTLTARSAGKDKRTQNSILGGNTKQFSHFGEQCDN